MTLLYAVHNLSSRKQLIPVNFIFDTSRKPAGSAESTPADGAKEIKGKDEALEAICPSCKKTLSNNALMFCECFRADLSSADLIGFGSNEAMRSRRLQDMHGLASQDFQPVRLVR